jgi:uncharacterized protein (DUF302 family)
VRDYARRVVIDSTFNRAVELTIEAFEREGLHIIGCVDLQDYAQRRLHHDLRQYVLLQVLPARLTIDALQHDLDAGTIVPVTVAIYELADGETAVVAGEPFAPLLADLAWQASAPELASIAGRESEQLGRALARLQHLAARRAAAAAAGPASASPRAPLERARPPRGLRTASV